MILGLAKLLTEIDLEGISQGLGEAKDKVTTGFGSIAGSVGPILGGAVVAGVAAATTAVVAIGAAAIDVASQMDASQRDIQAQLGKTAAEAELSADSVRSIYGQNFGADIADVTESLIAVEQQFASLGDVSAESTEQATINALRLRDAFDVDVTESAGAAAALMDQFGLSQGEAFDFLTYGIQNGLNASDDLLDTIGEYGGLFNDMGFSADEFYSILDSGGQNGLLGTDRIADAFKEFGIIALEGGEGIQETFSGMGLNFEEMQGAVADGSGQWADYFPQILEGLQAIEDPIERQAAQVALFGTAAEDLGVNFAESLDMGVASMEAMSGATEGLDVQYGSMSEVAEGFGRRAQLALEPIGEVLLNLANEAMPLVEAGFKWFEETMVPMIESAAEKAQAFLDAFKTGLEEGKTPLDAFRGAIESVLGEDALAKFDNAWTKTSEFIENVKAGWQVVTDTLDSAKVGAKFLMDQWQEMVENVGIGYDTYIEPLITALMEFASWLETTDFSLDFSLPELPEWMDFGSPLLLHHKLMDFNSWLKSNPLELNMGGLDGGNGLVGALDGAKGGASNVTIQTGDIITAATDSTGLGLDMGQTMRGVVRSMGVQL